MLINYVHAYPILPWGNILKAKILTGKVSRADLPKLIGVNPYYLDKTLKKAEHYSKEELTKMIIECQNTDYLIKSGEKDSWNAVEELIIKSHLINKSI